LWERFCQHPDLVGPAANLFNAVISARGWPRLKHSGMQAKALPQFAGSLLKAMGKLKPIHICKKILWHLFIGVVIINTMSSLSFARLPKKVNALYLPAHSFSARKINEFIHYAELAGINAAVLHVKDPHGWIRWKSENATAVEIGAVAATGRVEPVLKRLKAEGFWTIAKLDLFVDHRLVTRHPEMGITDTATGGPWVDKNGLGWANPYHQAVWEYNIDLAQELVVLGFDEIQFDYIRFPSDGNLASIHYPHKPEHLDRPRCIGMFLESAYARLHPLGVTISVDLFGLVAWKTEDFGIGQVIESIAPHVDVICPMLYPSHFPPGFLGRQTPGDYPLEIMEMSLKRLRKRTDKSIRPWIQGFWYSTRKINAQINGLANAQTTDWSVWNPGGNYATTYAALARRLNQTFPEPQFYPSLAEIASRDQRIIPGNSRVVNLTDYKNGYSIISLEKPGTHKTPAYATLIQVLETLDEGIMDHILTIRRIPFSRRTARYSKKLWLADLFCRDLQTEPRLLRPRPVYIDWSNDCRFTLAIPRERLSSYRAAGEAVFTADRDILAGMTWSAID
jgi:hypothetical protein